MQKSSKRWANGFGYKNQSLVYNAILKYGWENIRHETLFDNLTKEEAEQREIQLIKEYNSNNEKYGYNIQNGGNIIGTHSEHTKEKIRQAHMGFQHSDETKRKISETKKGKSVEALKGKNNGMYGKKHTEEWLKQASERIKGDKNPMKNKEYVVKNSASKKMKIICIETGIIYSSITEAGEATNIKSGRITDTCRGRQKTAGGYHWKYYIDKAS